MAYKILCLSGGGMRGVFQAKLLESLEKDLGQFWKDFDLIAGTSTGAIVALGLALNKDPSELVEFFEKDGPKIFSQRTYTVTRSPFYSNAPLKQAFERVFKKARLGDCKPEVAILSTVLDDFSIRVFSPLTKGTDKSILAVNAAMASTAAPGYFLSYIAGNRTYIDGGIWGNDPSIAALTLANERRMIDFKHMRLMHIGNGGKLLGTTKSKYDKVAPVVMPYYLLEMFFSTQSDAAQELTNRILGSRNVLDINVDLAPPIKLEDHKRALSVLPKLAKGVAKEKLEDVKRFISDDD